LTFQSFSKLKYYEVELIEEQGNKKGILVPCSSRSTKYMSPMM